MTTNDDGWVVRCGSGPHRGFYRRQMGGYARDLADAGVWPEAEARRLANNCDTVLQRQVIVHDPEPLVYWCAECSWPVWSGALHACPGPEWGPL